MTTVVVVHNQILYIILNEAAADGLTRKILEFSFLQHVKIE